MMRRLPAERLVFIDESGLNASMTRTHAWVKKGHKLVERTPMNWGKNLTLLGARRLSGWVLRSTMFDTTNKDRFGSWLVHRLLPRLKRGDILILDDLKAHHDWRVKPWCKLHGVRVLYLRPTRTTSTRSSLDGGFRSSTSGSTHLEPAARARRKASAAQNHAAALPQLVRTLWIRRSTQVISGVRTAFSTTGAPRFACAHCALQRDRRFRSEEQQGQQHGTSDIAARATVPSLVLQVSAMRTYKLLLADPKGRVVEHPWLLASLRSDESLLPPTGRPIPLPPAAKLAHLPGRVPVGVDPESGELVLVKEFELDGKRFTPHAVGAVLPPGYTRTYLPGEVKSDGPVLPQWAYTAAAWGKDGPVVWAVHTDRRKHWTPENFSTPEVKTLVKEHLARFPNNQVLKQLKTCALVYRCFTSQNVFYARDEGGIPASVMCNAACVGCISDQPEDGPPASHERMDHGPTAEEMADIGVYHLDHAPGRTMISYGQGCEGEPLTRWKPIADSIRLIRARTQRGSININTNGSLTKGLSALFDAGLDAVRVSTNSVVKDLYEAYYQPNRYGWEDVEASIALARKQKAYLALNLLLFPGVTDREGEVDALLKLVKKYRVDQIQTRPLAIDPAQYIDIARGRGAGGAPIGVAEMLKHLQAKAPWLVIGNFARGLGERRVES